MIDEKTILKFINQIDKSYKRGKLTFQVRGPDLVYAILDNDQELCIMRTVDAVGFMCVYVFELIVGNQCVSVVKEPEHVSSDPHVEESQIINDLLRSKDINSNKAFTILKHIFTSVQEHNSLLEMQPFIRATKCLKTLH